MNITGVCKSAVQQIFALSFNSTISGLGHPELTIDWTPATSLQFFECNLHPDDLEESSDFKYPVSFLHGIRSSNTHEQYGTDFSGSVVLSLRFYSSSRADKAKTAARALELQGDAIEDTVNELFADNQWPQLFGVTRGVCASWPMVREPVSAAGENYRQGFLFTLTIDLTTS